MGHEKRLPIGHRLYAPVAVREDLEEQRELLHAMGFGDEDLCLIHIPGDHEHGMIDQIVPCNHEWEDDTRIAHQGKLFCRFCGNNKSK